MNAREESRQNWTGSSTVESINSGSLQRIADAAELMAKNYIALQARAESAERSANYWREQYEKKVHQVRALRGVVTKLRKTRLSSNLKLSGDLPDNTR